jgi:NAD(P)-dependent dehydrogenase (short-subunit alcohol dehydrogenase family)
MRPGTTASGLEDRTAVVTGAASGIGRACVTRLAAAGAHVLAVDRVSCSGSFDDELAARVVSVHADVSCADDVRRVVDAANERFGRLDALVNNAGIADAEVAIVDAPDEQLDRMHQVNTRGVWLGIKYGAALMRRCGGGSIVNVASTAGISAFPRMAAYAASKAGVVGLTLAAARELGPDGIRVNVVCPGPTDTPLRRSALEASGRPAVVAPADDRTALKRVATPMEIAHVIVFLLGDEASFVTGAVVPVDGGQRA